MQYVIEFDVRQFDPKTQKYVETHSKLLPIGTEREKNSTLTNLDLNPNVRNLSCNGVRFRAVERH